MAQTATNAQGQQVVWDEESGAWVPHRGMAESVAIGAGRSLSNVWNNLRLGLANVGGLDEAGERIRQEMASEQAAFEPLARAQPVSTAIGRALPALATAPIGMLGAAGMAGRLATGVGVGAVEGAATADPGEQMQGAQMGAAFGAGGELVGSMAGRVVNAARGMRERSLDEATQALGRRYEQITGGRLSPAQQTGSQTLETIEAAAQRNPALNWMDIRDTQRAQAGYNRAAVEALGLEAPADLSGINAGMLDQAASRIGKVFDDAAKGIERVPISSAELDDMAEAFSMDARRIVEQYKRRWPGLDEGVLTGKQWSHFRQANAKDVRSAWRNNPGAAEDLGRVQDWLVSKANVANPGMRARLDEAKKQWTVLRALERPAGLNPQGDVNAGVVGRALARADRFGFGRGGIGGGDEALERFYDATRGMNRFASRIPTSGTAEGLLAAQAIESPRQALTTAVAGGLARPLYRAAAPMAVEGLASPVGGAVGRTLGLMADDELQ